MTACSGLSAMWIWTRSSFRSKNCSILRLKGKPVVVGGKADQRGVVAAASYAARKFGVHSAMPLRTAARLCPQAIFVDGQPGRYREYSKQVFAILNRFSPQVEMASIDEAYLDLTGTGRLLGPPLQAAHALHEEIGKQTSLRCSLGLASSRLVAKVSSDQAKPNGVLYILPGQEARFLAPLDVRKIPGVGKRTEAELHKLGIRRVGDLAILEEAFLASRFGRWGLALAGKARGEDAGGWFDAEVGEGDGPKSISHEHTFGEDTAKASRLETALFKLSEMVAKRLREHQLYSRTIQLKLRYEDFTTITRACSLDHATQLDREVAAAVIRLFRAGLGRQGSDTAARRACRLTPTCGRPDEPSRRGANSTAAGRISLGRSHTWQVRRRQHFTREDSQVRHSRKSARKSFWSSGKRTR